MGIYLDESVISLSLFTPDIDLFDISRVEVLRGPQGTLFGSGSLAGTVRYITNQPEVGVSEGFGEFSLNSVGDGGMGGNAKVAVNVPVGDAAAMRITAYHTAFGGFMDAVQPDLNYEFEQTAAFFEITWTASERVDLTAGARWYDYEENRSQVFDGLFADPRGLGTRVDPDFDRRRRHDERGFRHRAGQPPADGAEVPGRGRRDLPLGGRRLGRLPDEPAADDRHQQPDQLLARSLRS